MKMTRVGCNAIKHKSVFPQLKRLSSDRDPVSSNNAV